MTAKLTNDLLSEIDARPGEPIRVVGPSGERAFYILDEQQLTNLEAAANRLSEESTQRLRQLIAEGDSSPDIPAKVAERRIMQMAREADARHA